MKKNLLTLFIVLASGVLTANAQIQRGNVLVGGDITNLNLGLNEGSPFSVRVNPKAAWFIKDNTALGAYLDLGFATAKGQNSRFEYGVGILGRQYLSGNAINAVRHTRFFVEANVGIEGINDNQVVPKSSTNGLGLGIGPGLAYFITPNVGLEGLFKYQGIVGFGTRPTTSNLNLSVGFQIYLPNRTIRNAATNTQ